MEFQVDNRRRDLCGYLRNIVKKDNLEIMLRDIERRMADLDTKIEDGTTDESEDSLARAYNGLYLQQLTIKADICTVERALIDFELKEYFTD